jgi:hypothetical protein
MSIVLKVMIGLVIGGVIGFLVSLVSKYAGASGT